MHPRVPDKEHPLRLALLISGGGRTMVNLHQQLLAQELPAEIACVVSSRRDVAGVARAQELGLPVTVVDRKELSDGAFQEQLTDAVVDCDLICCAGFLSLWQIPPSRLGCVINIHPALLPSFGGKGMFGMHVHRAVINANAEESGCSIHYCDNEYDHGPVIHQRRISVLAGESPENLAERVFAEECIAYPEVIAMFCKGQVSPMDEMNGSDRSSVG
ncbi:MAG: phosphoribosylglycinamide formyltransferase [Phycisphaerae bacterium]